jgi:hypothetical protein
MRGFATMNSKTMEKWQAAKIAKALYPGANYLVRLRERMEKVGFPYNDELYQHVCAAFDAVQRLSMKAHYLSCSGVDAPRQLGAS